MQCLECIRQNAINVTFDDLGGYMVKKVLMLEACNSVCIIWWLDSGRFLILTYIVSTYWCCYKIGRYLIGIGFMYFYLHYFIAILRRQLHWLHGKMYDVWLVHSTILVLYHKYIPTDTYVLENRTILWLNLKPCRKDTKSNKSSGI